MSSFGSGARYFAGFLGGSKDSIVNGPTSCPCACRSNPHTVRLWHKQQGKVWVSHNRAAWYRLARQIGREQLRG